MTTSYQGTNHMSFVLDALVRKQADQRAHAVLPPPIELKTTSGIAWGIAASMLMLNLALLYYLFFHQTSDQQAPQANTKADIAALEAIAPARPDNAAHLDNGINSHYSSNSYNDSAQHPTSKPPSYRADQPIVITPQTANANGTAPGILINQVYSNADQSHLTSFNTTTQTNIPSPPIPNVNVEPIKKPIEYGFPVVDLHTLPLHEQEIYQRLSILNATPDPDTNANRVLINGVMTQRGSVYQGLTVIEISNGQLILAEFSKGSVRGIRIPR